MNGIENGLDCVFCRVLGAAFVASLVIGLAAIEAWGPIGFIVVGTPLVGWLESFRGA